MGAIASALSAAVVACITAFAAIRTSRTNSVTQSNQQAIEYLQMQLTGWKDFAEAYLAEINRLKAQHEADMARLQQELDQCKENGQT